MNPYILAICAALGFGSAWKIQDWRADAKEKERVEQILADQRLAAASNIRRLDNVISAQDRAVSRMAVLRVAADGSRAALISLSDAADSALRTAADSQAACLSRATTLSELLKTSAGAYERMAEVADRHASDVQTLVDAWPKR
jgi:hypothetical protein